MFIHRRCSVALLISTLLVAALVVSFHPFVSTEGIILGRSQHSSTRLGHRYCFANAAKRSNVDDYDDPGEDSHDDDMTDAEPSREPTPQPSEHDEAITDQVLQRFVGKGTTFLRWISQSANEATQDMRQESLAVTSSQSPFTHYQDLRSNGWVLTVDPGSQHTSWATDLPIERDLQSLGFDTTFQVLLPVNPQVRTAPGAGTYGLEVAHVGTAANSYIKREHYLESTVDNSNYQPTYAAHSVVYSPKNGAFIGFRSDSPTSTIQAGDAQGASRPPPLNRASDVVFLDYKQLCERQGYAVEDLRYIFGFRVTNSWTRALLFQILQHQTPPRDPRHTTWQHRLVLHPNSNQFKAVLGSPIGSIYAYLLINHKQAWADKRIKSISIFFDEVTLEETERDHQHPTLLFELETVGGDKAGSKQYVGKSGGVQKQQPKKGSGGSRGSRQSARLKGQQAAS